MSHNGYPRVCVGGKWRKLHRITYCEHHNLTLEDIQGEVVRHTCDTPNCTNPEHLIIGTDADNMQDKVNRDRQSKGTDFKHAKLTDDDVLFIKPYTNKGCISTGYGAMAKQFGVSRTVVAGIMNGTLWKHVVPS